MPTRSLHHTTSRELQQFLTPSDDNDRSEHVTNRHGVWGPGIRLMRNMQFVAKGSLIGVLFLIPIVWLAWAFFSNSSAQIAFSAKERLGVQYNRAIFPVIHQAQQLRHEAHAATTSPSAELDKLRTQLQAAQTTMAEAEKTWGGDMASAKAFAAGQTALNGAMQAPAGDAAFKAYSDAIAALVTLLEQVTDASNLTLDPDIDSYYVMDAALFRLPTLLESTTRLRDLGLAGMQAGSFTPAQKQALTEIISVADFHLGALVAGMAKATTYNAEVAPHVKPSAASEATAAFFALARKSVVEGDAVSAATQAAYLASANAALSAQYALTPPLLEMLDQLIATRVRAMEIQRIETIGILALGLVLALYFFYSFFLVTRGGLQLISKHLDEMSHGDLRNRPHKPWGTDEPAHVILDLRKSYDSLHALIRKVRHSARTLHASSGEIAAASTDLGSRTETAAAELEQQASAMDTIGSTVNATADLATMAATFALDNANVAERGGQVFAEVVTTMREIHASSSKIHDIISVIDGIAFQTNILALNAAVEAARAGESGRGFAVVAAEVRSLAQRSASAAREIKGLISASVDKVEGGTRIVEAAGQNMGDVVSNARQINQFLSEISVAAREQASGVSEVGRSIQELDKTTQQNAALVEETMAAAAALTSQADSLQGEIANFRVA